MPDTPRQNYWLFVAKRAWAEIKGVVALLAGLCGVLVAAFILLRTGFSSLHDVLEAVLFAVGGGPIGLVFEFTFRFLRAIPKIYNEQLDKIQTLEERKHDAESKQKIKEELTRLFVSISSRRSAIQDMGGERYHLEFMSKRDKASGDLVDEAERFLRINFDEAKARIFRDTSGFAKFSATNSSYPIWNRMVDNLEQYAIRLQKIIEELN